MFAVRAVASYNFAMGEMKIFTPSRNIFLKLLMIILMGILIVKKHMNIPLQKAVRFASSDFSSYE